MKAMDPLPRIKGKKNHVHIYKSSFISNIEKFTKILRLRPRGSMDPIIRSHDFL